MYALTFENAMPQQRPNHEGRGRATPRSSEAGAAPLVGRADALAELSALLACAREGRGALALIAGEPGIGKTRLARELMRRADRQGVCVLFGACWEREGRPPFWPWTQIVRAVALDFAGVGAPVDGSPQDVLDALTSAKVTAEHGDAAPSTRFAALDRVARLLRALAARKPVLVVLDDLQWADDASLQLLRFLASDLERQPVLAIGTLRDVELGATHPHAGQLAELWTRANAITLSGLSVAEVGELARESGARGLDARMASALHTRTGGNPLFVRELARDAGASRGDLDAVRLSPGIAQVLARRLQRLSGPCRAALCAASVLGPRFSLALLQRLIDAEPGGRPSGDLLSEAVTARLLERCTQDEEFCFVHALIHEACYAQLGTATARHLHRRAAESIAASHAHELSEFHAQLATHYEHAGDPVDLANALQQLLLAARTAEARFAHSDAAQSFTRALELLDRLGTGDPRHRAEMLLGLGTAEMKAGRSDRGRSALRQAAAFAIAAGDGETVARAALAFGVPLAVGKSDLEEVELLTRAEKRLDRRDSALRASLLARLATALMFATEEVRCTELADEALAMARRVGDAGTLARVLSTRHQTRWDGGFADERQALIEEAIALADDAGECRLSVELRGLRLGDLLELGEIAAYRIGLADYDERVTAGHHLGLGWHVLLHRASLAVLDARLKAAEQHAGEALALGRRFEQPGIDLFHASLFLVLRFVEGRAGELIDMLAALVERFPALAVYRASLAACAGEAGQLDLAREHLEYLATDNYARLPHDYQRIACMALLCATCHRLGDVERARALYPLMLPFQRYHVRVTRHGTTTLGSAEQFLGMLALTSGEPERAVAHFEAAVCANRRLGFFAMLASSLRQLAGGLRARGLPGDAAACERAHCEAQALTQRFGLAPLFHAAPAVTSPFAARTQRTRLCREGDYWLIEHDGTSLRMRDSVGLQLLARLLAEPNREFAAIELRGDGALVARTGDAGPVLDERAIAAYKRRRGELARELAEAQAWADASRRAALQHELAALEHELSAGLGLGGKTRRAAGSLERARVTVTKALRATVLRLAREHRGLGDHLDRAVRTGHVCVYRPDPNHPIDWRVSAA